MLILIGLTISSCAQADGSAGAPQDTGDRDASQEDTASAAAADREPAFAAESCVTEFSRAALAEQAFAFDGTVAEVTSEIDPQLEDDGSGVRPQPRALFEVSEWFVGGAEPTVWIWLQRDVAVGDHLLVSGQPRWGGNPLDNAIQWECGFTVEYTEADADFWRSATP